ncbi:MAG: DnaJ domain-containing protein [Thermoanaerobaculia bacterium]|nr:DnaJ domain-containing protein [Thermoanaerobaculia bacterium]
MAKNYYAVLGLPQNATTRQVRERFLEFARTRHPDRFPGEEKERVEREFQEITEAFNVLTDPRRRSELDAQLARPTAAAAPEKNQAAKVYLQRGIRAYREKNFLQAAENFDRATREDPEMAKAWHYLAAAARHQKRWLSRARTAAARACELEPMNSDYLKLAGQVFAESGMTSRAERYLAEALNWGGEDPAITKALELLRSGGGRKRINLFGKVS